MIGEGRGGGGVVRFGCVLCLCWVRACACAWKLLNAWIEEEEGREIKNPAPHWIPRCRDTKGSEKLRWVEVGRTEEGTANPGMVGICRSYHEQIRIFFNSHFGQICNCTKKTRHVSNLCIERAMRGKIPPPPPVASHNR